MSKKLQFFGAILAPLSALLIMSFLKGESLDGANYLISKLSDGFPKAISLIVSIFTSKIAIFIYGFLACYFVGRLSNFQKRDDATEDSSRPSPTTLRDLAEVIETLMSEMLYANQSGRYSMTIHERNKIRIFYETIFTEMVDLEIFTGTVPQFETVLDGHMIEMEDYLSQVSIYLKSNQFEKAKNVKCSFV